MAKRENMVYFIVEPIFLFQRECLFVQEGFISSKSVNKDGTITYEIIEPIETEYAATSKYHRISSEFVFDNEDDARAKLEEIRKGFNDKGN